MRGMYEVVAVVLLVMAVFLAFFLYNYNREGRLAAEQERRINSEGKPSSSPKGATSRER